MLLIVKKFDIVMLISEPLLYMYFILKIKMQGLFSSNYIYVLNYDFTPVW